MRRRKDIKCNSPIAVKSGNSQPKSSSRTGNSDGSGDWFQIFIKIDTIMDMWVLTYHFHWRPDETSCWGNGTDWVWFIYYSV